MAPVAPHMMQAAVLAQGFFPSGLSVFVSSLMPRLYRERATASKSPALGYNWESRVDLSGVTLVGGARSHVLPLSFAPRGAETRTGTRGLAINSDGCRETSFQTRFPLSAGVHASSEMRQAQNSAVAELKACLESLNRAGGLKDHRVITVAHNSRDARGGLRA